VPQDEFLCRLVHIGLRDDFHTSGVLYLVPFLPYLFGFVATDRRSGSAISLNSRLSIDFALQNSKKIVFDAESGMKRQQGQGQQFQSKLEKDEIAEWWCCGFKREGKKKWVNATCRDAEKSGPSDWSWHAPTNVRRKN
jgi:hypothetical protein